MSVNLKKALWWFSDFDVSVNETLYDNFNLESN